VALRFLYNGHTLPSCISERKIDFCEKKFKSLIPHLISRSLLISVLPQKLNFVRCPLRWFGQHVSICACTFINLPYTNVSSLPLSGPFLTSHSPCQKCFTVYICTIFIHDVIILCEVFSPNDCIHITFHSIHWLV